MDKIKVWYTGDTIYKSDDATRMVALYITEAGEVITFAGSHLPEIKNICYTMVGDWMPNSRYGRQFHALSVVANPCAGKDATIHYLSSGLIPGIGEKTANQIYETFGEDTFNVLKTAPERLCEVPGITSAKCKRIIDEYRRISSGDSVFNLLSDLGCNWVTPEICNAIKIYAEEHYCDVSELIHNQPYELINIQEIDFTKVDDLAEKIGFLPTSEERIKAAALSILRQNEKLGCSSMELDNFAHTLRRTLRAFTMTSEELNTAILRLINEDHLITYQHLQTKGENSQLIYRTVTYETEIRVYQSLRIIASNKSMPIFDLTEMIASYERRHHVTINQEQIQAVRMALQYPCSIITANSDRNRNTVFQCILSLFQSTHPDAETEVMESADKIKNPKASLVIVYNASAMDIFDAAQLLNTLPPNAQLVFIGRSQPYDPHSSTLNNIIKSRLLPFMQLTGTCPYKPEPDTNKHSRMNQVIPMDRCVRRNTMDTKPTFSTFKNALKQERLYV